MLDDEHGGVRLFLNAVDELDGLLARRGVKVGQRLVEQQDLHRVHHHARQAHPLLLPAGKLVGRKAQVMVHVYQLGGAGHGGATLPAVDELLAVDMGCIGEDLSCTEYQVSI